MKKSIVLILCMCLSISMLVGCTELGENKESQTEDQKPSESEKLSEFETESHKPSETQKPSESETQKPSESETQEPSESETREPSESETQKPSESETQEPSETETQEPSETETEGPSEQYEEYILSTQTYMFARQVSEKYYIVSDDEGDYYGLVDFMGTVIVPIQYEEYDVVSENEIAFRECGGQEETDVYSLETGELLFKYISCSDIDWKDEYKETILSNGIEHKIMYADSNGDPFEYFYADMAILRHYQAGLIMECYPVFDCTEVYEYGALPRNYITFKDAKKGIVIYEGYTTYLGFDTPEESDDNENSFWDVEGEPYIVEFSSDLSESKAVMLEYSIKEGKYYLVYIDLDGYKKHEIKDLSIFGGRIAYCNDWLKMPWTSTMVNTKTMEIIELPIQKESVDSWSNGKGEYFAVPGSDHDSSYTIYKGKKAIASGYKGISFTEYSIIGIGQNEKYAFMNYEGEEMLLVIDYGEFINGRCMVCDEVGIYYVDTNLNRVSNYVYKGKVDDCRAGVIRIDDNYYLIAKK